MRNVDWSKVFPEGYSIRDDKNAAKKKKKYFRKAVEKRAKEAAKSWFIGIYGTKGTEAEINAAFEKWWKGGSLPKGMEISKAENKMLSDKLQRVYFLNQARLSFAIPGKQMMTLNAIDNQIDALRSFRNAIIDAYTIVKKENGKTVITIPETVKDTVVPEEVTQSNGIFDTVKENDGINPVYRSIVSEDMSVDDIQKMLDSDDLILGYGTGVFGH
uniref:Uncharacterized protein n=1 Tax=Dulem virus 42 TaxID=3145760 RepID=A0AAU8B9L7_9CAUD